MRLINIFPNAERLLLINIDSVLRYGSALLPNYSQPAKSTNDKDDFISSSVSKSFALISSSETVYNVLSIYSPLMSDV